MDILPRVKNGEFAYFSHRKLVGTTASRIVATVSQRIGHLSSSTVDAAMRVAYNLVAAKRLSCLRVALFHNAVKPADWEVITAMESAALIKIDRKPNRAPVMVIYEATNTLYIDELDSISVPSHARRPEVVVRSRITGKPVNKVDGAEFDRRKNEVRTLNTWADSFLVTYRPSWSKHAVRMLPDALYYTRIFLDNFNTYGRFTALFQSLSKEDRNTIRINNANTCELDFVAMHPRLVYAKARQTPPSDLYGFLPHLPREWRKLALLISLNARTASDALTALSTRIGDSRIAGRLLTAAAAFHAPIAKYMGSDIGVSLMWVESDIAAEILTQCHLANLPVLCIHDGFRCRVPDAQAVKKIMENVTARMVGMPLPVDIKYIK